MARAFVVVVLLLITSACTKRLVCPAYQSAFIYDKESMRKKFSYFKEDSTPKILTASKSKYLIAVPESYRKKYRKMQTVEMKPVYPVIPDSLKVDKEADLLLAERDEVEVDSAAAASKKIEPGDSAYAITKTKEKFNLDQDLYMWYFREMLVLPDVRAAMQKKSEEKEAPAKDTAVKGGTETKKKRRGLFGRKESADSIQVDGPPPSTTDTEAPKKKGGLFKKKKQEEPTKKKDPAKKEEKDDGFGS